MEISTFELYLILKLDDIKTSLTVLLFVILLVSVAISIFTVEDENIFLFVWKYIKRISIPALAILIPLVTLLPSTKQMAALYILPPVINNEQVQQLPSELLGVLGLSLERVKELLEKTEESSN